MYQKQLTDQAEIRKLSRLSSSVSILVTAADWGLIIIAIAAHILFRHPVVYFFSWLIIGSRMYALYSLLHDGIHYLHFRNKRWNDAFSSVFMAWPLGISLHKMRLFHLKHHKYLQTSDDPEMAHLQYKEFKFPQTKAALFWTFTKDILGVNFVYYFITRQLRIIASFFSSNNNSTPSAFKTEDALKWSSYVLFGAIIIYFGWWLPFLIYWLIPYATLYQALNRLRLSTEHFHLDKEQYFQTRTVEPGIPEKFIFTPHNLGYHTEHHLFPSVPFYRLPGLHKLLMEQPEYRKRVLKEKSYRQVIQHYIS